MLGTLGKLKKARVYSGCKAGILIPNDNRPGQHPLMWVLAIKAKGVKEEKQSIEPIVLEGMQGDMGLAQSLKR